MYWKIQSRNQFPRNFIHKIKASIKLALILINDFYSQFFQLRIVNIARRIHHQILRRSGFREGDDIADVVGFLQEHHDAFDAGGETSVRRRAVFQRVEEKSETFLGLFRALNPAL